MATQQYKEYIPKLQQEIENNTHGDGEELATDNSGTHHILKFTEINTTIMVSIN
jgi:hypothetical protein